MNVQEKVSETLLLEEDDFYSHLNVEDITDTDHEHTKRVLKDFGIKHLGECRDFYVQNNTLLLAYVFDNFWKVA